MSSWVAKVGESPDFVAFMAHSGFAYFCVHHGLPWWLALILAAAKEFVFDIRYEKNPPQTYTDGALDFMGYAVGVGLGVWL